MMRGTKFTDVQVERDLGVQIDCVLKFCQHAAIVVAKSTQILAVICHSFALIDERTLPLIYKALVRPHLEYGNLVWGPFKGRVPPYLTHNGFPRFFYNSNPITTFPCAPFPDIQALKHEFPNPYLPAIINNLHLYFVFWP